MTIEATNENDQNGTYLAAITPSIEANKEIMLDQAADYTRNKLFWLKQFVADDDLVFGKSLQKLVCNTLNVAGKDAEKFWETWGGREHVRTAIRHKRQSVIQMMKRSFYSK